MAYGENGMTPADMAAVMGNNGGFGNNMFGDGAWWIIILLLFGWGGNRGGFGCGNDSCATQADVRAAVDQQTLISKLDRQTYGLADSTYALNNTLMQGFHGVDRGLCDISHQISDCCCTTQRAIDSVNYNMTKGFCDLGFAMERNTRDVIENQNQNGRAILDFLVKDKIDTLQNENQALRFQASQAQQNAYIAANQEAQTAELIRRLRTPEPVPAYVVANPNCCYQYAQPVQQCCGNAF